MIDIIKCRPGQEVGADSGRKASKIAGTWKQHSGRFLLPCFSDLRCFPEGSSGIRWPEFST